MFNRVFIRCSVETVKPPPAFSFCPSFDLWGTEKLKRDLKTTCLNPCSGSSAHYTRQYEQTIMYTLWFGFELGWADGGRSYNNTHTQFVGLSFVNTFSRRFKLLSQQEPTSHSQHKWHVVSIWEVFTAAAVWPATPHFSVCVQQLQRRWGEEEDEEPGFEMWIQAPGSV